MKSRTFAGHGVSEDRRRVQSDTMSSNRTSAVSRQTLREILRGAEIATKMEVGATNDEHEQQADQIADQVMSLPEVHLQRQEEPEEEEPLQAKLRDGQATYTPAGLATQISALRQAGGRPLPDATRTFFEPRFDADLSKVRLHTGKASEELADTLHAQAFTCGNDIAFGEGAFRPETDSGKWLIAHELAHVLQKQNRILRWTRTGVKNILCPSRDRWVVARLSGMDVYEFNKIERHWKTYHKTKSGGKGAFAKNVSYEVDGLAQSSATPPYVYIKKSLSDSEAAATCFHEVTHTGQSAAMPMLSREYDAWIQEEYFRLRHGLPEAITGSTFTGGGVKIADVDLIKKNVKALYQHRDPSNPYVWEFDKQVPDGVKKVTGWMCPPAPKGMPAYYDKPPRAVIDTGTKLRAVHTSGSKRGYIYLTLQSLGSGTQVAVLRDAVSRVDYDKMIKSMVEILHNERNYWVPAGDIKYP